MFTYVEICDKEYHNCTDLTDVNNNRKQSGETMRFSVPGHLQGDYYLVVHEAGGAGDECVEPARVNFGEGYRGACRWVDQGWPAAERWGNSDGGDNSH